MNENYESATAKKLEFDLRNPSGPLFIFNRDYADYTDYLKWLENRRYSNGLPPKLMGMGIEFTFWLCYTD